MLAFNEIEKINDYPKEKWADLLALIPVIGQLNHGGLPVAQRFLMIYTVCGKWWGCENPSKPFL